MEMIKHKEFDRHVGKTIRDFRRQVGLTPLQASKRYGCSLEKWKRYEQGAVRSLRVLFLIGVALGFDPVFFIGKVIPGDKRFFKELG
jgi:transcriptional regulator with XRE-family HTH domain